MKRAILNHGSCIMYSIVHTLSTDKSYYLGMSSNYCKNVGNISASIVLMRRKGEPVDLSTTIQKQPLQPCIGWKIKTYPLNILHHDILDLCNLRFDLCKLVHLIWMLNAVFHLLFQPGSHRQGIGYASPKITHKWIVELAACSSTSATSKATATLLFFWNRTQIPGQDYRRQPSLSSLLDSVS